MRTDGEIDVRMMLTANTMRLKTHCNRRGFYATVFAFSHRLNLLFFYRLFFKTFKVPSRKKKEILYLIGAINKTTLVTV